MKKPVKLGLWLLGFAVLALLGLWLEHERAKARLEAFKAQLIAKGEKLAVADHVPKLPPALSNAAPDFIAAANRITELKPEFLLLKMRLVAPGRARVAWQQAELPTDKEPDLWPFISAHVEENRPLLAEMTAALARPEFVFNLDYSKGFNLLLPHLAKMKQAAIILNNAALLDLHHDEKDSALTNLLASIRLVRVNEEPLIISQLVRVAVGQIAVQGTWELLQHPGWSDAQLAQMQRAWQESDTTRGWLAAIQMERATMGTFAFAECRGNWFRFRKLLEMFGSGSVSRSSTPFFELLWDNPSEAAGQAGQLCVLAGWSLWFSYADERHTLETQQVWIDCFRQASASTNFAPAQTRMAAGLKALGTPPMTMLFSRNLLGSLDRTPTKFANFETTRRLTFTAIALHRHRLKHGKFPESLGALVPEFLAEVPRDFMDGQPLRYKLQPDGQFLLWSVGEDFKDDGGDPTPAGWPSSGAVWLDSSTLDWLKGRDWVWPQAATEAGVRLYHTQLETKRALIVPKPAP